VLEKLALSHQSIYNLKCNVLWVFNNDIIILRTPHTNTHIIHLNTEIRFLQYLDFAQLYIDSPQLINSKLQIV